MRHFNRPGEVGGDGNYGKNDLRRILVQFILQKIHKANSRILSVHEMNFNLFYDKGKKRKGAVF